MTQLLTNADIVELVSFRHDLHRHPELSGHEAETAARVAAMLRPTAPDEVLTGLGGHGVAAVYAGTSPGPTVLLRCELDGLPIDDLGPAEHRSTSPGRGHQCGHDGHMTMLAATARLIGRKRPTRGRVVLLFQPAEEDGAGAARVIADDRFARIAPDWAFAIHNMPGVPLGHGWLTSGPVNCASRGMRLHLVGRTAHASQPETGISPVATLSALMPALTGLSRGVPEDGRGFRLVTVTHARMGEPAFGVAPGAAQLWATLRTLVDAEMARLVAEAEALAHQAAAQGGLGLSIDYDDIFMHCENHTEATAILAAALDAEAVPHEPGGLPMRGSEDFGRFGHGARSAMLFLGSGTDMPALHNPDFDFPDALIPVGARILTRVVRDLLG